MSEAQDQSQSHRKRKKKKVEVMMDYVPPKEGFSCPLVGYFPSGFDPEKQKNKGMEEDEAGGGALKATAYQNTERYKARQHQLVVTPPQGTVDFVGTNYTGESAAWQPGHYALGVFDKDTRTLKLLPIGGAKVLRMEPRVRGVEYYDFSTADVEVAPMSKELKLQKRKLLTSTFGTHKSQVRLSRYERGQVKEEALGDKEQISQLFEKAGDNRTVLTSDEALQQANAAIMRNIPPYDLTAITPEKAFIFDKIITPEEQASLNVSLLKEMAGNPDKIQEVLEEQTYPEFVLKRLNKLKLQDKGNKAAVILAYMRHLIVFYNLPRSVVRSINLTNNSNIPSVVWMKLLKHFTTISQESNSEHETRIQTQENRNLLISYILVLGLMVDDFNADPYDLALELRMPISQLRPHYMELGCKFKGVKHTERVAVDENSAQGLYRVVLPVPLKFQTLKAKARRKK